MDTAGLTIAVVVGAFVAAAAAVFAAIRRRSIVSILVAASAVGGLGFVVLIAARLYPESNYVTSLLQTVLNRDKSALVAVVLGIAIGVPWGLAAINSEAAERPSNWRGRLQSLFVPLALVLSFAGFLLAFVVLTARAEFDSPAFARMLWSSSVDQHGFSVRRIAKVGPMESHPVSLAVDDDENVYVSLQTYFIGKEHGGVEVYTRNEDGTSYSSRMVVDSPVLARPFGLAVRDGDIYVSRSGRLGFIDDGQISHVLSGAVTRIRDLNGDGDFEFMDDILVGLPGSRGPDPQHQNQAIAFRPDGSLLVTNGTPSDHAPPTHPWEGVILELSPDFKEARVFAEGFRNPFGMTVTEAGNVIATDNDSSTDPGDELNWVVPGAHHGHPYDHDKTLETEGFVKPIFRAPRFSNFVGVVQVPTDHPSEELRGALLVADISMDRVWRIRIKEDGDHVEVVDAKPFFDVPAPLNVVVGPSGTIYVLSYGIYSSNALFAITAP